MLKPAVAAAAMALAAGAAFGQPAAAPYAGMESRSVKALSAQQIADLKAGRGMGLALAAELNGYPGPIHVLEQSAKLGLSPEQTARVRGLYEAMKAEAVPLGEGVIAQETELDRLFASKAVTPEALAAATSEIGTTQGELRNAHLKYHLAAAAILTPEQARRYAELRGYRHGPAHRQDHH